LILINKVSSAWGILISTIIIIADCLSLQLLFASSVFIFLHGCQSRKSLYVLEDVW
jgi:hypothetical protein